MLVSSASVIDHCIKVYWQHWKQRNATSIPSNKIHHLLEHLERLASTVSLVSWALMTLFIFFVFYVVIYTL